METPRSAARDFLVHVQTRRKRAGQDARAGLEIGRLGLCHGQHRRPRVHRLRRFGRNLIRHVLSTGHRFCDQLS